MPRSACSLVISDSPLVASQDQRPDLCAHLRGSLRRRALLRAVVQHAAAARVEGSRGPHVPDEESQLDRWVPLNQSRFHSLFLPRHLPSLRPQIGRTCSGQGLGFWRRTLRSRGARHRPSASSSFRTCWHSCSCRSRHQVTCAACLAVPRSLCAHCRLTPPAQTESASFEGCERAWA